MTVNQTSNTSTHVLLPAFVEKVGQPLPFDAVTISRPVHSLNFNVANYPQMNRSHAFIPIVTARRITGHLQSHPDLSLLYLHPILARALQAVLTFRQISASHQEHQFVPDFLPIIVISV